MIPKKVNPKKCSLGVGHTTEWVVYIGGFDESGRPFDSCQICMGWHKPDGSEDRRTK
jgi:hypothetical protein